MIPWSSPNVGIRITHGCLARKCSVRHGGDVSRDSASVRCRTSVHGRITTHVRWTDPSITPCVRPKPSPADPTGLCSLTSAQPAEVRTSSLINVHENKKSPANKICSKNIFMKTLILNVLWILKTSHFFIYFKNAFILVMWTLRKHSVSFCKHGNVTFEWTF